ncbi:MAG: hypothetical protein WCG25_01080 [bacterium]
MPAHKYQKTQDLSFLSIISSISQLVSCFIYSQTLRVIHVLE